MKKSVHDRKSELLTRLKELDSRVGHIGDELDEPVSKDWEEAAVEAEDDEVLERLGSSAEGEIAQIRAALKRIDEGEYGYCVKCGNEISEDRLNLLPATPFCRNCAH